MVDYCELARVKKEARDDSIAVSPAVCKKRRPPLRPRAAGAGAHRFCGDIITAQLLARGGGDEEEVARRERRERSVLARAATAAAAPAGTTAASATAAIAPLDGAAQKLGEVRRGDVSRIAIEAIAEDGRAESKGRR